MLLARLLLAGFLAAQACACMPSRGPAATALNYPASRTAVSVPTTLTSNRSDAPSTLILGVQ